MRRAVIVGLRLVGEVRFYALWATVGLVIGPLAGVVGWRLTSQRGSLTAVVTLATVSVAEPLALWTHIDHLDDHLAAAGLAFPLIWFRRDWRRTLRALALALVLTYRPRGDSRSHLDRISSDLSADEADLRQSTASTRCVPILCTFMTPRYTHRLTLVELIRDRSAVRWLRERGYIRPRKV